MERRAGEGIGAGKGIGAGDEFGAGDGKLCGEDGGGEKTEEQTPRFSKKFSTFFFSSAVMDMHLLQ